MHSSLSPRLHDPRQDKGLEPCVPPEQVFKGASQPGWPLLWPAVCQAYVQHCLPGRIPQPDDLDAVTAGTLAARELEEAAEALW